MKKNYTCTVYVKDDILGEAMVYGFEFDFDQDKAKFGTDEYDTAKELFDKKVRLEVEETKEDFDEE